MIHRSKRVSKELKNTQNSVLKNESITYQNMWDVAKAMLSRKFIKLKAYITNKKKSEINNKMSYLKNY